MHPPASASRKAVAETPKEAGRRFEVLCPPSPARSARESLKGVPSTTEGVELIKYMKKSKLIIHVYLCFMRCILLKPVLKYMSHTIYHLNHFFQHTIQWHELAGIPNLQDLISDELRWSCYNTNRIKASQCNQSACLKTIPHHSPWKHSLPRESYLA